MTFLRNNYFYKAFFEDPSCTKGNKQPDATFWKRISPYLSYEIIFVATLCFFGTPKLKPSRTIRKIANSKFEILKNLKFWNFQILRFEIWKSEICQFEIFKKMNFENLKFLKFENLKIWKFKNWISEIMKFWTFEISNIWQFESLKFENLKF